MWNSVHVKFLLFGFLIPCYPASLLKSSVRLASELPSLKLPFSHLYMGEVMVLALWHWPYVTGKA